MSLIHWWPLNNSSRDLGTQPLALIEEGGIEFSAVGRTVGKGATYLSTKQHARLKGTDLDVLTSLNEYTLACWVYLTGTGAYNTTVMFLSSGNFNNSGQYITFGLSSYNSTDGYTVLNIPNATECYGGISLSADNCVKLNKWYHIAVTFKNNVTTGYINGVPVGTYSGTKMLTNTTYPYYYIGASTYYADFTVRGTISDFRIYSHALSKKEIRELYKANILHYDFENITTSLGTNILKNTTVSMTSLGASVSNHIQLGPSSMTFTVGSANTTRMLIPLELLSANQVYRVSFIVQDASSTATFRLSDWCDSGSITDLTIRKIGSNRYFISADISRSGYDSTYRFMDFYASAAGTYSIYNFQICPVITKIMDGSGYGNDGENNGVTFTATTPLGTKAASFASGKYIKIPDPFKSSFSEATWSMWINENSGENSYKSIYHSYGNPTGTYWIAVNTESVPLWFYRSGYIRGKGISFTANTFHHIAITFKDGVYQWYFNGSPTTMETTVNPTSLPCSEYMSLGDSYTGTSWGGTPFTGQIADFKIHATALSANDVAEEYKTRIQIARDSSLFVNRIKEDGNVRNAVFDYKMNANVNSISEYDFKNKFDGNIYEEPDGSKWLHVCHHNNPGSTNLFASGDDFVNSVYKDANRWFNMEVCNYLSSWEILVKQQLTSGSTEYKYRWKQYKNPMTAVFGDVDAADVTYNTTSGYTSTTYGGMYRLNSSTYLAANNGVSGNWWGATGSYNTHNSGIPAWNGQVVTTGYYDVYVRIDNTTITDNGTNFKSFNMGTVYAKNIIEY